MTGPAPVAPRSVSLVSTSRAADAGFLTLADLAEITTALELDHRIVGGHMVTLLVALHGVSAQVPLRETADADFAALPTVVADPRLPAELVERGYTSREAANRFMREVEDSHGPLTLVVDILAPSYRGALVPNQRHGELVVDEVPGLVLALHRPAELLDVHVQLTSGEPLGLRVMLPDVASALCLKALAYRGRFAAKDAVDLWRPINAAYAAGLRVGNWPGSVTGRQGAEVLHRFFGAPQAAGLKQMSTSTADRIRMQALVREVVPVP
ncbi:hypothetical protein KBX50_22485 [Micromonospora sp. C51]|uniref:hypothetical protein n=1 Tax=Micromonospora sp. C51 TaxID=2824879 RepID=UPI001B37E700|nr:hypothetical protein [Micromonospora sp. C51]MBQ1051228.1 hypothetical protein [Micromonospora sp. C51]